MKPEHKILAENLILNQKKTDPEVAAILGIDTQAVRRFRVNKLGIKKKLNGSFPTVKNEEGETVVKQELKPLTVEDKELKYQVLLKQSPRYLRLKDKLDAGALSDFVTNWAKMKATIEDLTVSEEDALEIMLIYQLRINDNQKQLKEAVENEERLRAEIGDRELDLANEIDRIYNETIQANNRYKLELNKDLQSLTDKYLLLQKSLNQTREQREAKQKVGADTFLTLVRNLSDIKKREAMGRYNELMKLAAQKQIKEFKEVHEFVDKTMEPILLDGEDFLKGKRSE